MQQLLGRVPWPRMKRVWSSMSRKTHGIAAATWCETWLQVPAIHEAYLLYSPNGRNRVATSHECQCIKDIFCASCSVYWELFSLSYRTCVTFYTIFWWESFPATGMPSKTDALLIRQYWNIGEETRSGISTANAKAANHGISVPWRQWNRSEIDADEALKNGVVESGGFFWEHFDSTSFNIQGVGFPRVGRRYTYAFSAPEVLFGKNSFQTNTQILATINHLYI